MEERQKSVHFVIIAEKKLANDCIAVLVDNGGRGIVLKHVKGSAKSGLLGHALGFDIEETKVMITCLIHKYEAIEVMGKLCTEYNFTKPNTGIAFTVPLEGLLF